MLLTADCSRSNPNAPRSCFDHQADFVAVGLAVVVAVLLVEGVLKLWWRRHPPRGYEDGPPPLATLWLLTWLADHVPGRRR